VRKRTAELSLEIIQRRKTEEVLMESEEKYRRLAESSPDGIVILQNGVCVFANMMALRLAGVSSQIEMLGKNWLEFVEPVHRELVAVRMKQLLEIGSADKLEEEFVKKDGAIVVLEIVTIPFTFNSMPAVQVVYRDITERKQTENLLISSLKEKEVLIKEIHHRVKNNMQVISSLLNLQIVQITDPVARELFVESQNRIKSMALVHERLYQSQNLASVDFKEYVERLVAGLARSYSRPGVAITCEVEDVSFGVDTAIPCGLIINELVSNSLKHGFPEGRGGSVVVRIARDGVQSMSLVVQDTGVGFPEKVVISETTSLGLELVNSLVRQLAGTVTLDRSSGSAVRVSFSIPD
jgi:PAS domain S-box-containing protein